MTESTSTSAGRDLGLALGWSTASELIKPFGTVAANFTEAIRLLAAAHSNSLPMSPGGSNHIVRLIKNDTIKAIYYFFSKQFRPEVITAKPHLTPQDFLKAYNPIDHAAILTLCYLFKNLSKRIDKEEWEYVQTPLYESLAIGGQLGKNINEVGLGLGLLTRGMRYLAFAPLMRENRKAFKEYRQHLKAKDVSFDLEFEQRVWQCTTVQIASLLLEQMGYPRSAAMHFVGAVERSTSLTPDPTFGVPFRLAECLMDAYMEGHEIPTSTPAWVGQEISLPAEIRGTLLMSLKQSSEDNNRSEWLNKTGADITPGGTPEIFVTAGTLPTS
jgi:hypothetical protein